MSRIITPSDEVVVIGPNEHVAWDPTLACVSHLMAMSQSNQKLFVVNSQWENGSPGSVKDEGIENFYTGNGSVKHHFSELVELQDVGQIPLCPPQWCGQESWMMHMTFPEKTNPRCRIVIDHATLSFFGLLV